MNSVSIICCFQINLGVYVADKKSEFSVLVDRATGGSSINDGEIELMLHRYNKKGKVLCKRVLPCCILYVLLNNISCFIKKTY